MRWAVGVTSCPARLNNLLPRTLASLCDGGFDVDLLAVDGAEHADPYRKFGIPVVSTRFPAVNVHPHWELTARELFYRKRDADWFLISQDDMVVCRNLREYLERNPPPGEMSWGNLSSPKHEVVAAKGRTGWVASQWTNGHGPQTQRGYSAFGLVFSHAAMCALLSSDHWIERTIDKRNSRKFPKYVDGAIVTALNKAGWVEHCHHPALATHIGVVSSIRNKSWPAPEFFAPTFVGEDYDALALLKEEGVTSNANHASVANP